jgi:hypothetical protein
LRHIWERADAPDAVYSFDELVRWSPAAAEQLQTWGLLRRAANATAVVCDACGGGHVETVILLESPPGTGPRAYIVCPEAGRVFVPLDRLKRWEVNFGALAELTASALATAGAVEEVVPSRVWLLGKTTLLGRPREFFLARGLTWRDGPTVVSRAQRLQASPCPVVLVAGSIPKPEVWTCDPPPVVALAAVLATQGERIVADRALLECGVPNARKAHPPAPTASFPTPPGATWEAVRLVVSDHGLRVEVGDRRRDFTFQEAGFEDRKRGGVPDRLWTLLRVFARRGGAIPFDSPDLSQSERSNLKQNVSGLRKRLAALLNIKGGPFLDSRHARQYVARFKVTAEGLPAFPTPAGTSWDAVSIEEVRAGVIRVCIEATEDAVVYVHEDNDDNAGTRGRWEGAEQLGVVQREYDLCILGLADAGGEANEVGKALLAMLRGAGKVRREQDDESMLALCGLLTKLLQINQPPFQFSDRQQTWSALFDASSTLYRSR